MKIMKNFKLTEKETSEIQEFMKKHENCCFEKLNKHFFSTTGGQFSFIFTPTGLGNVVIIKCNACDKTEDVTDISNW